MRKHLQFRLAELLAGIAVVGVCCGLARHQLAIALAFALAAGAVAIVCRRVPLWLNLAVILGSASVVSGGFALVLFAAQTSTIRELGHTEAQLLFFAGSGLTFLGLPVLLLSTIIYGVCVAVYVSEGERGLCRAVGIRWSGDECRSKVQGRNLVPPD